MTEGHLKRSLLFAELVHSLSPGLSPKLKTTLAWTRQWRWLLANSFLYLFARCEGHAPLSELDQESSSWLIQSKLPFPQQMRTA